MSTYEDYNRVSSRYDLSRSAIDADEIAGLLRNGDSPVRPLQILDAGCGTGNYTYALHGAGFSVTGVDLNDGMLRAARSKKHAVGGVGLVRGDLLEMPFHSDCFDGALVSYVLHHLDPEGGSLDRVLGELQRVLKTDATLVIVTSSPEQMRDGFWWTALIPHARDRMIARLSAPEQLMSSLHRHGFHHVSKTVPFEAVVQEERFADPHAPLDPHFRGGDSTWSLATDDELESGLSRLKEMIETGAIDEFMREREGLRIRQGQLTLVSGVKYD
jgi:ubiquinone/menaquinone biosynthesis C-methylase UbiE